MAARRLSVTNFRGRAVVRDGDEDHRTATPLELFFDLTFVAAVARSASVLEHELAAGHVADGIIGFCGVFFAIWWGWMNYTWFASGHDSDDVAFRVLTLIQMVGVLIFAAGVTRAVEADQWLVCTIGYGVMRVGLIWGWLRVARDEPSSRMRAMRFVRGLILLQVLWFARLLLPPELSLISFVVLAAGELLLPPWAERALPAPIFHPKHIEERYGLFTIIVLGESVLSATVSFQTELDADGLTPSLFVVGIGALVIAFGAWWLYFYHPGHLAPTKDNAFKWGYAHVVIFTALAALGSGIHLAVDSLSQHHGDERTAALAVALPVAVFLCGLVLVLMVIGKRIHNINVWPKVTGAVLITVVGLTLPVVATVAVTAAIVAVLVTWMVLESGPHPFHSVTSMDPRP